MTTHLQLSAVASQSVGVGANVAKARERFTASGLNFAIVTAVLVNRISSEDATKVETQTDSGIAKYRQRFPELGDLDSRQAWVFDLHGEGRFRGEAERARLGMVPMYARDLSDRAVDPAALVGFISVRQRVLVLDVLSSAAEDNIRDDDIDGLGRNLFTEFVRTAVVAWEDRLQDILFSRWDRMLRNGRHGAYLKETISRRAHLITLSVNGQVRDIDSLGSEVEQVVAVAAKKFDSEKQFSGAYTKCANHEWVKAEYQLPEGARLGVGRQRNSVHWLPLEVAIVSELYALRATGASLVAVTARATELGLRLRHPRNRRADGTAPTLAERYPGDTPETAEIHRHRRQAVVTALFASAKRQVYRTGEYPFRMVAPVPGTAIVDGAAVQFATGPDPVLHAVPRRGVITKDLRYYGYRDFLLDWGLPTLPEGHPVPPPAPGGDDPLEGLNLRSSQWERIEAPHAPGDPDADETSQPALNSGFGGAAAADDDHGRPFLGLPTWLDRSTLSEPETGEPVYTDRNGVNYRRVERKICSGNPDALNVRERRPQTRGWATREGVLTVTVRDGDLARSVASFLRSLIDSARAGRIQFTSNRRHPDDRMARLAAKSASLQALIDAKEHEARGHRANAAAAAADHADPTSATALAAAKPYRDDAARAAADAAQARAGLARLQEQMDEASATTYSAVADLTRLDVLADVLEAGADARRPRYVREVHDALAAVFKDTFRLIPDTDNPKLAYWTGTAHIDVGGNDITFTAPRFPLVNHRRGVSDSEADAALTDAVAAMLLRDGLSLHELYSAYHRTSGRALERVRSWLACCVSKRGLRSALADCPVPATKRAVYASATGAAQDPAGSLRAFEEHVAATYRSDLAHPNRWIQRDTTLARRAINALLALPNPAGGALIADLARTLGITPQQVNLLTDGTSERYLGVLVRDANNRRRVRLRPCPHGDCDTTVGHRWASHYLPVPETLAPGGHGLLCPDCLRLPDTRYAQITFPADYLHMWELADDANASGRSLRQGHLTVPGDPCQYEPPSALPRRALELTIYEAAAYLGVSDTALRSWSDTGKIRCRRLHNAPGGRVRVFAQRDLDKIKGADFVTEWLSVYGQEPTDDPDHATLADIAAWAAVGEWHLRDLIAAGRLTAHKKRTQAQRVLTLSWRQVSAVLTPEWRRRHALTNLAIGEVARLAGATTFQVRQATRVTVPGGRPELPSMLTDGGTRVFARHDVDAWLAGPGRRFRLLTPKEAVALAGVGDTDVLRHAAAAGVLPVLFTAGGHARYARDDVLRWASAAGRPEPLPNP